MDDSFRVWRFIPAMAVFAIALATCGCIGAISHMLYVIKGNDIPAEYKGLEGKRVAVVCVSDSGSYDPGSVAASLSGTVEDLLGANVKEIELIYQNEVTEWIDGNNWSEIDYSEVGRGVDADMVVAIDLLSFSLHEGKTLYKGRASVKITVFDIKHHGRRVYSKSLDEFSFPKQGGQYINDVPEARFRHTFLYILGRQIAKNFYKHDAHMDIAGDPVSLDG